MAISLYEIRKSLRIFDQAPPSFGGVFLGLPPWLVPVPRVPRVGREVFLTSDELLGY